MNKQYVTILVLLDLSAALPLITAFSLTDYRQNLVWMVLPLTGSDQASLSSGRRLTCGMAFLRARVLIYFSLQFMQAHFFDVVEKHLPAVHCHADDSH